MSTKKIISYIFTLLVFTFFIYKTGINLREVSTDILIHLKFYPILFSILILIVLYLMNGLSWHFLMSFLGDKSSLLSHLKTWSISNLARYLPGGIWQYGGRVYLSKGKSQKARAIIALIIEITFNLLLAFIFSLPIISKVFLIPLPWAILGVLLLLIYLSFILVNRFFSFGLKVLGYIFFKKVVFNQLLLRKKYIIFLALTILLQFLLPSISLLLITGMFSSKIPPFPEIFSSFSLSWAIGYISIFSPGGLGVQEGILSSLFSQYYNFQVAFSIALLYRILLTLAEVIYLGFLFFSIQKIDTDFKE